MLRLWSRVPQTSCRCKSCLTTISRPTTTLGSRSVGRVTIGDIFTACYSGMFASAALADMKLKADRREQWDRAIEEVKSQGAAKTAERGLSSSTGAAPAVGESMEAEASHPTVVPLNTARDFQAESALAAARVDWSSPASAVQPKSAADEATLIQQTGRLATVPEKSAFDEAAQSLAEAQSSEAARVPVIQLGQVPRSSNEGGDWREAAPAVVAGAVPDKDNIAWDAAQSDDFQEGWSRAEETRSEAAPNMQPSESCTRESVQTEPQSIQSASEMDTPESNIENAAGDLVDEMQARLDSRTRAINGREDTLSERNPAKIQHLHAAELAIARLVTRLLMCTSLFLKDESGSQTQRPISPAMAAMMKQLRQLHLESVRLPSYAFGSQEDDRPQLHTYLQSMFEKAALDAMLDTDLLITKLCYNLLVAISPPNILIYNLLIRSLSKLRLYDAAEVVIAGYFTDSRLAANSETVVVMLTHYSNFQDEHGFLKLLGSLGAAGNGFYFRPDLHALKTARRDGRKALAAGRPLSNIQQYAALTQLYRAEDAPDDMPHVKVPTPWSGVTLDAVIQGLVNLTRANRMGFNLKIAVRYMIVAFETAVTISPDVFVMLVKDILRGPERRLAIKLLDKLMETWDFPDFQRKVPRTLVYSSEVRGAVHRLFRFCHIKSLRYPPKDVSARAATRLARHMRKESYKDGKDDGRFVESNFSNDAILSAEEAKLLRKRQEEKLETLHRKMRLQTIGSFAAELLSLRREISTFEEECIALTYTRLPLGKQRQYDRRILRNRTLGTFQERQKLDYIGQILRETTERQMLFEQFESIHDTTMILAGQIGDIQSEPFFGHLEAICTAIKTLTGDFWEKRCEALFGQFNSIQNAITTLARQIREIREIRCEALFGEFQSIRDTTMSCAGQLWDIRFDMGQASKVPTQPKERLTSDIIRAANRDGLRSLKLPFSALQDATEQKFWLDPHEDLQSPEAREALFSRFASIHKTITICAGQIWDMRSAMEQAQKQQIEEPAELKRRPVHEQGGASTPVKRKDNECEALFSRFVAIHKTITICAGQIWNVRSALEQAEKQQIEEPAELNHRRVHEQAGVPTPVKTEDHECNALYKKFQAIKKSVNACAGQLWDIRSALEQAQKQRIEEPAELKRGPVHKQDVIPTPVRREDNECDALHEELRAVKKLVDACAGQLWEITMGHEARHRTKL